MNEIHEGQSVLKERCKEVLPIPQFSVTTPYHRLSKAMMVLVRSIVPLDADRLHSCMWQIGLNKLSKTWKTRLEEPNEVIEIHI